jgi:hypothetical protein
MQLESIEHARFRALSQLIIDQEKGVEAFEEYMKLAFPYLEATKRRDRKKFIQIMQEEIQRGPMVVTPMQQPKMRSRLKQRVVYKGGKAKEELYDKLGNVVPV